MQENAKLQTEVELKVLAVVAADTDSRVTNLEQELKEDKKKAMDVKAVKDQAIGAKDTLKKQVEAMKKECDVAKNSKNTEADKLRKQLEEAKQKLQGLQEAEPGKTNAEFETAKKALREQLDEAKELAIKANEDGLSGEHGRTVETLKQAHEGAQSTLKTEHDSALGELKKEHGAAISELKKEHRAVIKTLEGRHDSALESTKKEARVNEASKWEKKRIEDVTAAKSCNCFIQ